MPEEGGLRSTASKALSQVVKSVNTTVRFAQGNAKSLEDYADPFGSSAEAVYFVSGLFGLIWSFSVTITETQGINYFPIKATLAQVLVNVLSIVSLIISATSVAVNLLGTSKDFFGTLGGRVPSFKDAFIPYIATIRSHVFTVIFLSLFYALFYDSKAYAESHELLFACGFVSWVTSGCARVLNEIRHSDTFRGKKDWRVTIGTENLNIGTRYRVKGDKNSRIPAFLLMIALLVLRAASDDGLFDGTYWSHGATSGLMIALIAVTLGFMFFEADNEESHITKAFSTLMVLNFIALLFALGALQSLKSEATIVTFLGLYIFDYMRVGIIVPRESNEITSVIMTSFYRGSHFVAGVIGFILINIGVDERMGFGDDLADDELPATPKILRDVALIACTLKILGVFYQLSVTVDESGKRSISAKKPITGNNVENTLRQISSTLLLLSSSWIWAHEKVVFKEGNENYGFGLFILGLVARLVDSIQDAYLVGATESYSDFAKYYFIWWDKEQDTSSSDSIETAKVDNPRSWIVLAAIATSIGMASYMHGTFEMDFENNEHFGLMNGLAIAFMVVHALVIVLQLVSKINDKTAVVQYGALSRSPGIRFCVTTATLIFLMMALSEVGFSGTGDGILSNSPSASEETLEVKYKQWNMLGALVAYLSADLIGHVFL